MSYVVIGARLQDLKLNQRFPVNQYTEEGEYGQEAARYWYEKVLEQTQAGSKPFGFRGARPFCGATYRGGGRSSLTWEKQRQGNSPAPKWAISGTIT